MRKYLIAIEEITVQEFEVKAESAEIAMEIATDKYRSGKFVLEPGEVQFRMIAITEPEDEVTEWIEF